ncbi:MoxR family ATPase [Candidatus Marsarchaeota archaeon]|nr:MoxR family ATPase [Candidatus Marsarchaeota archaeon]
MDPKEAYEKVFQEVKKHIAGNEETIKLIFVALTANGHILLEGVPGIAKTTMTKTMAETIDASFGRVQGMPDIEISDIIGYAYLDESHNVVLKKGPIFNNMLLIDELNRMPPKTTTALLEALEERQVTIGNSTLPLTKPFIALATQNPLNIEGTTQLPKVLTDRFLMRVEVTYPSMEEEEEMLRIKEKEEQIIVNKVIGKEDILEMQSLVNSIEMPDEVENYITKLVEATRKDIHVVMGASPRAEISFMKCSKAKALIEGRKSITIDDVKYLAKAVLSHRVVARATGGIGVGGIINGIVATLPSG